MISLDDVLRAREAIGERLHRTPTFTSATLSTHADARVVLKAELFQRTGSFKPRGMLNAISALSAEDKRRGVVTISAGNAAQGLAYCAALEGVDALVVMWQGASAAKIEASRSYGATVDLEAPGPVEAFERLEQLRAESGRTFVHPFDDPVLQAGHGTLALELIEQVQDVDVVVVPVGGGGLISGVATAIKGRRSGARVVAVEPEGSAALHHALAAEKPVHITPASIADGLNAPFAGGNALAVCRERVDESVLVTEAEIESAFRFLYARTKLACEPAGAAATAALLAGKIQHERDESIAVVVSGGNVAPEIASAILAKR